MTDERIARGDRKFVARVILAGTVIAIGGVMFFSSGFFAGCSQRAAKIFESVTAIK
ncbi:MAG: hypothetical protein R3A47_03835 [Polyangiales bacterium]